MRWQDLARKRRRKRQDAYPFFGFTPSNGFALPANATLGVKASGASQAAGACFTANARTLNAPALTGEQVHWLGWFERGVVITAEAGYELVADLGGGIVGSILTA